MTTPAASHHHSAPDPDTAAGPALDGAPLLRMSGPADLVQAIPYLIGFRPTDSVVVVALAGHRLLMTARVDLDADPAAALAPAWSSAAQQGASAVVLSVHDDAASAGDLPWRDLVTQLSAEAEAAGLDVRDVLCVGDRCFWSYVCADPSCCPPEGRAIEVDGVVAAELVFQGRQVVERREALAVEIVPDAERADRVLARVAAQRAPSGSDAARSAAGEVLLDQLVRSATLPLDDETAAAALVALADLQVRDTQLGRRSERDAARAAALWGDLACAAPSGLRAAPLTLLAVASYARGDGARAHVALEAALSDRRDYSLARLLSQGIGAALPPASLVDALDEGARESRRLLRSALTSRRRRPRGGR